MSINRPDVPVRVIPDAETGIVHIRGCRANYPEKPAGEAPQAVERIEANGRAWVQCVNCGAVKEVPVPTEA